MSIIKPLQKVPQLAINTLEGKKWHLYEQKPKHFIMVVFYRGYHCLTCKNYIHDLGSQVNSFNNLGVDLIAISCDTKERAQMSKQEWHLPRLRVGYGLTIEEARNWGLFISKKVFQLEPDEFSEPGIFIINPDFTLYGSIVQTMPFSRPTFFSLLSDIGYIIEHKYPARGSF